MFVSHEKSIVNLKFVAAIVIEDKAIHFLGEPLSSDHDLPLPLIEKWYFSDEREFRSALNSLQEIMGTVHC